MARKPSLPRGHVYLRCPVMALANGATARHPTCSFRRRDRNLAARTALTSTNITARTRQSSPVYSSYVDNNGFAPNPGPHPLAPLSPSGHLLSPSRHLLSLICICMHGPSVGTPPPQKPTYETTALCPPFFFLVMALISLLGTGCEGKQGRVSPCSRLELQLLAAKESSRYYSHYRK